MTETETEVKKKYYLVTVDVRMTRDYVVEAGSKAEALDEAEDLACEEYDVAEPEVYASVATPCDESGCPVLREVTDG